MKRLDALLLTLVIALLSWPALAEEEQPVYTVYIDLPPAFVTHVGPPAERPSYLKTDISLRVATETAAEAITAHMPRLRHELVMLFGEQDDLDTLSSAEGQRALREAARERINRVLEDQRTGEQVTDVLFSTFVIQR